MSALPHSRTTIKAPRKGRNSEIARLMPTWLIDVLTTALCLMVLVPISCIFVASLNSDAGGAQDEVWPS
ncbi:hypothetical protein AAGW05_00970 [Arthrobacter sp. LAPM80]|uniref:hypothetical protein n=1 Tax=Arthrobacter sp. LAPM80 TaxID=3141788 RepID=UPI00398B5186